VVGSRYITIQNATSAPYGQTLQLDAGALFGDYGQLAALAGDCIAIGGQARGIAQGISGKQMRPSL
jgi:hypothetical protein